VSIQVLMMKSQRNSRYGTCDWTGKGMIHKGRVTDRRLLSAENSSDHCIWTIWQSDEY